MRHVSFTDLRNNLATHLDRLEEDRDELIIMRQKHEPVVIMRLADWESMSATAHLLSNPFNSERLRESIAEADAGKLTERELIEP